LNKWKERHRDKRGSGEFALALNELSECISSGADTEKTVELKELSSTINDFLLKLPVVERDVFVCRYWFFIPILEMSVKFAFSQSKIKSILFRTRKKLKIRLEQEGFL